MIRRDFLAALVGTSALARAAAKTTLDSVEVISVRVLKQDWVFVRIKTANGITGIGDASHSYRDAVLKENVKSFFARARGRSAFDVEPLRNEIFPLCAGKGLPAVIAFSGIEQAMWDIQGKALGLPCYELFGGKLRDRIRNYANINRTLAARTPDGFAAIAEKAVAAGFDAIKMASFDGMKKDDPGGTDLGVACIGAVRRVAGPSRDVLIDGHSHFSLQGAIAVAKRLESQKLFWLEEMCRSEDDLASFNQATSQTTAGGESLFGIKAFDSYISKRAVDITMPDVKYCGGMGELKKIAVMSEAAGLQCAPHGPASPVGNLAAAHVCATLPNFSILELGFGEVDWRGDMISPPEVLDKGHMVLTGKPGLGVELNEATVKKHLS
jgi:galactonate dehydratase